MDIAGYTGEVFPLFESTQIYFSKYLSERDPDFCVTVSPEDLAFEQQELDREAMAEGLKLRKFTDPFLERMSIARKFAEHLLLRGAIMLHGSAVAVDGKGYLFAAKCGTGKSTHTRLWCQTFADRAKMINDDKPFALVRGEELFLCGSPWSGKHGLDNNIAVPFAGICILERGAENQIQKMPQEEAWEYLLYQAQPAMDLKRYPGYKQALQQVLEKTGTWKMQCNRDPQAAVMAHRAMSAETVEEIPHSPV